MDDVPVAEVAGILLDPDLAIGDVVVSSASRLNFRPGPSALAGVAQARPNSSTIDVTLRTLIDMSMFPAD
jgi:hypothetical protein